jgi:hypothetical protein
MSTERRTGEEDSLAVVYAGDRRAQDLFEYEVSSVIRVELRAKVRQPTRSRQQDTISIAEQRRQFGECAH